MTVSLNAMTGRVTKRAGRSARVGREISRNFQNGRKQLRKRQMFERYKYVYTVFMGKYHKILCVTLIQCADLV